MKVVFLVRTDFMQKDYAYFLKIYTRSNATQFSLILMRHLF